MALAETEKSHVPGLHVNTSKVFHATYFYYLISRVFAAVSMNEP